MPYFYAALGAALFAGGTWIQCLSPARWQDLGWLAWLLGATNLAIGLNRLWPGTPSQRPWTSQDRWLVALLVLLATATRLGALWVFPGEAHLAGIEELQLGNWAATFLDGQRFRWEFIDDVRLTALAVYFGGPSLVALHAIFCIVGALTAWPLYAALRHIGRVGAVVGTGLFAISHWALIYSRGTHGHWTSWGAFVVVAALALIAGPVRRRHPSGYIWAAVAAGDIAWDYIGYRPLAVIVLAACLAYGNWRLRTMTAALFIGMVLPLVVLLRSPGHSPWEYADGWRRARLQDPVDGEDWAAKRLTNLGSTARLFWDRGEEGLARGLPNVPLLMPAVAMLTVAGLAAALVEGGLAAWAACGFLAALTGTLILTGNWDVGRASVAIPWAFVLVGCGTTWLWHRRFSVVVASLTLIAVVTEGSASWTFFHDPSMRRLQFFSMPFVEHWLATQPADHYFVSLTAPDIIGILSHSDGEWMRAGRQGAEFDNATAAAEAWRRHPGPKTLVVFVADHALRMYPETGQATLAWQDLAVRLPGLEWRAELPPDGVPGILYWAESE